MQLKLKSGFLIAICLTFGFFIYGCISEPNIDPIVRPYTMLRIGNFSTNIAKMNITITDTLLNETYTFNNLNQNELGADFVKVISGIKNVVVKDGTGKVVFDKALTMTAFQKSTLFFSGNWAVKDAENTLTTFFFNEGLVYTPSAPNGDSVHIFTVNASTDSLADAKKTVTPEIKYTITTKVGTPPRDTTYETTRTLTAMAFSNARGLLNVPKGNFKVKFTVGTDSIATQTYTMNEAGKRYFLITYGAPSKNRVLFKKYDPLPLMSK